MHRLVLFIKTYERDFPLVSRLLSSIAKHNIERIPVYVSVNTGHRQAFLDKVGADGVELMEDRDIVESRFIDPWRYQQVIKSSFYRTGISKNAVVIDSDAIFIRDFTYDTFMYDEETPYTVMHESKDMLEHSALHGHDMSSIFYQSAQRAIRNVIPNRGRQWDFGPCPFIWSSAVWERLNREYVAAQGLTLDHVLGHLESASGCPPSEYMLYGEYLWYTQHIPVIPIQPLFKVYHWKSQFLEDYHRGVRASHLSHNYWGVIVQSNWLHNELSDSNITEFLTT